MGREHCRFPRAAGVQFLGRAHAAASLTMEPMSLHGWWSEIKQFTRWLLHCRMLAPIRFDRAVISPNGFSILCYMTFIYRLNDWARGHSSAHFSTPLCGMRSVYAALENRNVIKSPFIITGEQIDVLKLALRKATTAAATTSINDVRLCTMQSVHYRAAIEIEIQQPFTLAPLLIREWKIGNCGRQWGPAHSKYWTIGSGLRCMYLIMMKIESNLNNQSEPVIEFGNNKWISHIFHIEEMKRLKREPNYMHLS